MLPVDLVQFLSIGALVVAVVAMTWNMASTPVIEENIFLEFWPFVIVFTTSYLGTYGIRRLFYNRALRRRESSE